MSYNYDQCLTSIQTHRQSAYKTPQQPDLDTLQKSMDEFANLSKHCPMTPLLWMQYAQDTEVLMHGLNLLDSSPSPDDNNNKQLNSIQAKKEALESSCGILELGLAEFSGCALLHLYYLESLCEYFYQCRREASCPGVGDMMEVREGSDLQNARDKLSQGFEAAWDALGRGSHVNEGAIVSEIYRLHGAYLLACLECAMGSNDVEIGGSVIEQLEVLCERWSKTPMGEGSNDEMMQDVENLWNETLSILTPHQGEKHELLSKRQSALLEAVDGNRRSTSSLTNVLSSYENEIDVAMANEGISFSRSLLEQRQENSATTNDAVTTGKHLQMLKRIDSKWGSIISGKDNRWLLGLGAGETSHAFSKYASFSLRSNQSQLDALQDHITTHKHSMTTSIYERAVSECPTVESLWTSYIKFLRGEWISIRDKCGQSNELQSLSNALQSITQRSVRNCPYSSNLFELRMTTLGLISTSNLEPDDITAVIQEATQLGFLNANREAMLSMRLVAINVVKRKLLSLVSRGTTLPANGGNGIEGGRDYDQEDELDISASSRKNKSTANNVQYKSLAPTVMEEVQDLIEDIRDMYEEADNYLFKSHVKWEAGRVCYWKHRCATEAYVLCPIAIGLRNATGNDEATTELADTEALKCFEKLVKTQKPCHPDSWKEYLRYVGTSRLHFLGDDSLQSTPGEIGALPAELRQTRGLYKRALSSTRKAGKVTPPSGAGLHPMLCQRDYDLALSDLCTEYLEFERNFGSEESLLAATALVRSKLANYDAAAAATSTSEDNGKRKLDSDGSQSAINEDQMQVEDDGGEDTGESRAKRTKVKTNLKEPKKTDAVHKVRIGKMDYPAHPFTIHVSNLSKDTQDMDLVDAFRPICGGIVHAKILREKLYGKGGHHSHGESKGCGLVQFEERMSVEKALEQNGQFNIGGKVAKINRSHLPAVGVVPQGMHRVNPKGEGKMSKRNQLKKKINNNTSDVEMECDDGGKASLTVNGTAGGQTSTKDEAAKKNKYRTSTSPGSIKLDSLSFKPRVVKQKPKISIENKK